ncbi:MAG: hypothetical protein Q8Q58_14740, partial [Candidatus Rokubacteria bacterium]|nr:hypothetical protein [Candidatus Rokubacteria bacterium]
PTLLAMMEAVDFRYVFVGIETPDKDLLVRTRKRQNTRGSIRPVGWAVAVPPPGPHGALTVGP